MTAAALAIAVTLTLVGGRPAARRRPRGAAHDLLLADVDEPRVHDDAVHGVEPRILVHHAQPLRHGRVRRYTKL
jgi:hypothetical protein